MPNPVKYSTTTPSGSLRKGNMAIGVDPSVALGPTSVTGFYAGITPPSNGYTIYQSKSLQGPSIYVVNNDSQLITYTNTQVAGTVGSPANFTTAAQCLNYYASQTDKICVNKNYPGIVTSGSVLNLDASFTPSYPTTASTWYDVSGTNNNGTLTNGPIFNSLGVINFDNVDDYVQISSSLDLNALAATRNMTICFTAKKLFYGTGGNNTGDSMVLIGADNGYNTGFRITEINTGTPGTPFTGSPHYNFGAPALGNGFAALSPRAINTNTFSYVCFAQSGSSITSFINGKFATGTLPNAYTPGANRGSIGRDIGAGVGWFGGYIGNFQIYNRTLSQAEILQNYYQAPIVTDGLVFAVDAGNLASYESGSTSTYSLTGSLSGSLINGTGYSNDSGGTWVFDGVDDYIDVPINSVFNTPSVTYEVWANLQTINDRHILYVNWQGNSLEVNSDRSVVMFNYSSLSQQGARTAASVFNWDTWTHFVGIYDNASQTLRTYVNGVLLATRTSTPSTIYSVSSHKISGTNFGGEVKGKISIVRHYNKSLSATEVTQNYNAQKSRFGI